MCMYLFLYVNENVNSGKICCVLQPPQRRNGRHHHRRPRRHTCSMKNGDYTSVKCSLPVLSWRHPVLVFLSLIVFGRVLRFEATALICVGESAERGCCSSGGRSCWTKYGSLGRINNGTGTGNRAFLESRISYQLGRRKNAGNLGDGRRCRSCCCCGRRWIELGIVVASQTWKILKLH